MKRNSGLSDESVGMTFGIVVVIFLFFVIYNFIYNKKRKDSIGNYCKQNGINYTVTSESIIGCNERFIMMNRGKAQRLDHIMSGIKNDYEFQIFDFNYTLEKPDPRFPVNKYNEELCETICFLKKKTNALPHFYMLEKSLLESDVDFLPHNNELKDIEFTLNNEEKLIVKTYNEGEIKQFFSDHRIESIKEKYTREYIYEVKGEYVLVAFLDVLSVKDRLILLEKALKFYNSLLF